MGTVLAHPQGEAVHGFQTAGALPFGAATAYDPYSTVEPTSWYGMLLAATVSLTPSVTALEISVWIAYTIAVLARCFRPNRVPAARVTLPAEASVAADSGA
jgi:high-affinity iron transporter